MSRPSLWLSVCAFVTVLLGAAAIVALYRWKVTPPDLDELKRRVAAAEEIICDISEIYGTRGERILVDKNRGRRSIVLSDRETLKHLSSKLQFSGKTERLGSSRISGIGEMIPATVKSTSHGETNFIVRAEHILYEKGQRGSKDYFYCFVSSDFYEELRRAIDAQLLVEPSIEEAK